jgi:hypothetical protein
MGHALPQEPQLALSVCSSTQAAPQAVRPAGHTQAPPTHDCAAEQAFPHVPQLSRSVAVFRHTPLHAVCPAAQAHTPAAHRAPCAQALPQAPQLAPSVWKFTQAPLQAVRPALQAAAHTPKEQRGPPIIEPGNRGMHTNPHAPQSFGLDARSTHAPAHSVGRVPWLQAQAPLTQAWPPAHARPHMPQLAASLARLTQAPPQDVVPAIPVQVF